MIDSIDDRACEFYKHHGFTPIGETLRLFAHIPDVTASIAPGRYDPISDVKYFGAAAFRWATTGSP